MASGSPGVNANEIARDGVRLISDDTAPRCTRAMVPALLGTFEVIPLLIAIFYAGELVWRDGVQESLDLDILRPASDPFDKEGGLRLVKGDLGRAVIKISAVKPENRIVEAPAAVFETQEDALQAFKDGKLFRDVVVVLRFQGPKASGRSAAE